MANDAMISWARDEGYETADEYIKDGGSRDGETEASILENAAFAVLERYSTARPGEQVQALNAWPDICTAYLSGWNARMAEK